MHRQEAARRLVHVHDSVCADSVLVHQPEQLDKEPVRIDVLLLRGVELFHALGGLLIAQAHAVQKLSDPSLGRASSSSASSHSCTMFLIVTALRHKRRRSLAGMCSLSCVCG